MVEVLELPLELDIVESLLQEAERVWKTSKKQYRDSVIKIGEIIEQIVLNRLKQADGKLESERLNNKFTRESAITDVAKRLKIEKRQAYQFVRIYKVVDLFGDPGGLSYTTLRQFIILISLKSCKIVRGRTRKHDYEVLPSESEIWEVKKPTNGINLYDVYNRAVKENWDSKTTNIFIKRNILIKRRNNGRGMNEKIKVNQDEVIFDEKTPLLKVAIMADPKDLVDMVLDMIKVCPRSEEFKKLLLQRIK